MNLICHLFWIVGVTVYTGVFAFRGNDSDRIAGDACTDNYCFVLTGFVLAGAFSILILLSLYRYRKNTSSVLRLMRRIEEEENELKVLTEKTEQMEAENERIAQANEALEKSNTVKDKLLSIISHDLRSPISSMHVLLNLFNANNIARRDLIDFVGKLLSRVENTTIMLENLLHWSQSQLNSIEPVFYKTDLREIIDNSIGFYRMQAEQKHIAIENLSKQAVFVIADMEMLKIVLRNLISNALKFTFEGGSITINTVRKEQEVIVSVKDTGTGISKESQEKMFSNVNFTTLGTDKEKGTGLGLLLCKDFVEHQRGKLWVESKEGKGATFYFSIPAAE
ncbi:MAG: HAMP domain-containing histidine kinase [Bacteroidales bacterium]|jgi:signal transduction histidine kinase|nr:HAMP domain-containing histidine kinase [Bacteroidales bacterium]